MLYLLLVMVMVVPLLFSISLLAQHQLLLQLCKLLLLLL
jgi:hypothetical protein